LLPLAARDVERMADDELAHGWAEEAWLTARARHDKVALGPQTCGGLAPAGPALIDFYRDRIAELRRFVTEHDLITVPAWLGAIDVQETPRFMQPVSPGASMVSPRQFSAETNGYYFITPPTSLADAAARLDMNQDFDRDRIVSTAAHEAMPGHFLQLSIAKRGSDCTAMTSTAGCSRRVGNASGARGPSWIRNWPQGNGATSRPRTSMPGKPDSLRRRPVRPWRRSRPTRGISLRTQWDVGRYNSYCRNTSGKPATKALCTIFTTGSCHTERRHWRSWGRSCWRISINPPAPSGPPRTIDVTGLRLHGHPKTRLKALTAPL
jgi:hypothetical protein